MSKKLRLDQPSTSSAFLEEVAHYSGATPSPNTSGVFGGGGGFSMSASSPSGTPYKGKYTRSLLGSAGNSSLSRYNPYSVRDRTAGRRSVPLIRAKRDDSGVVVPKSSSRATLSPVGLANTSSTAQRIMEKLANMSTPVLNAGRVRLDSISSIKPLQIGSTLLNSSAVMTPTSKFAGPPKTFSPFSVPKNPVGVKDPIDWSLKFVSGIPTKLVDCGTNTDEAIGTYLTEKRNNYSSSPRYSTSTALVLSKSSDMSGENLVTNGEFSFSSPWPLKEIDDYVGQEINRSYKHETPTLRAIEAPNESRGRTEDKVTLTNGGTVPKHTSDVNNSFLKLPTTPPIISPKKKWECSECWVTNNPADTKCICCGTSKPGPGGAKPVSVDNTELQTKPLLWKSPNVSTWECSGCWVTNNPKDTKCVCCGTSKPGSEGSAKSPSVDNTDGQNKPHLSNALTPTSTTPKRKADSENEDSSNKKISLGQDSSAPPTQAFKFGFQASTSEPKTSSVSTNPSDKLEVSERRKNETAASPHSKPVLGGFQFGAQPAASGTASSASSNPPAFSFGFTPTSNTLDSTKTTSSSSISTTSPGGFSFTGAGTGGFGSAGENATNTSSNSKPPTTTTPSLAFSTTANSTAGSSAVSSSSPTVTSTPAPAVTSSFGATASQPFAFGTPSSSENKKSEIQKEDAAIKPFSSGQNASTTTTQNFNFGSAASHSPLKVSMTVSPSAAPPVNPTSDNNPNFMEALKNASAAVKASSEKQPPTGFQVGTPTQPTSSGGIFGASAPSSSTNPPAFGFGYGSTASNTPEATKPTESVFQNISASTGGFGSTAPFGSGSTFTGTGNPLAGASGTGGFGSSSATEVTNTSQPTTTTSASTSAFGFSNAVNSTSGSSWIPPAASTPAPAVTPSFGSPAPSQPFTFGTPGSSMKTKAENQNEDISNKKFAFGPNPSAPSTQTSFAFGSPASATPSLNPAPSNNNVDFLEVLKNASAAAKASSDKQPGGFQFSALTQPAPSGGIFGAAPSTAQNPPAFGFGSNSSFGSSMPNATGVMNPNPGNLAFGIPPSAAPVTPAASQFSLTPNFNFGAPAPTTPSSSFNFGATNPPAGAAGQTQQPLFQFSSRGTPTGNQQEGRKIMKATRRFGRR